MFSDSNKQPDHLPYAASLVTLYSISPPVLQKFLLQQKLELARLNLAKEYDNIEKCDSAIAEAELDYQTRYQYKPQHAFENLSAAFQDSNLMVTGKDKEDRKTQQYWINCLNYYKTQFLLRLKDNQATPNLAIIKTIIELKTDIHTLANIKNKSPALEVIYTQFKKLDELVAEHREAVYSTAARAAEIANAKARMPGIREVVYARCKQLKHDIDATEESLAHIIAKQPDVNSIAKKTCRLKNIL